MLMRAFPSHFRSFVVLPELLIEPQSQLDASCHLRTYTLKKLKVPQAADPLGLQKLPARPQRLPCPLPQADSPGGHPPQPRVVWGGQLYAAEALDLERRLHRRPQRHLTAEPRRKGIAPPAEPHDRPQEVGLPVPDPLLQQPSASPPRCLRFRKKTGAPKLLDGSQQQRADRRRRPRPLAVLGGEPTLHIYWSWFCGKVRSTGIQCHHGHRIHHIVVGRTAASRPGEFSDAGMEMQPEGSRVAVLL